MKILVIGSGGRENALAWKLKQSPKVTGLFAAPGNPGTKDIATNVPLNSQREIIEWLKQNRMDLVVVGPDNYLADGIVDEIQNLGIKVFGPTKLASEIEWSKSYAKDLMKEIGIPTASFETFTDFEKALEYVKQNKFPTVIKASGLALGKGVIIAENFDEAEKALREIMTDKVFGEAGDEVVIEEYLMGREISTHAFCDGETVVMFPSSQDHKRIFEGDQGPNTGGMGTIAPVPWVTEQHIEDIKIQIVIPLIQALKKRGREFKGLLFPGIMITETGPKVIEFNARFGDPETESYMRILEGDLVDILLSCVDGTLKDTAINWSKQSAATVICASGGYPGSYEKGKEIIGLDKITDNDVVVFHCGTKLIQDKLVTNGGRVLAVTAVGDTVSDALAKSYKAIEGITFEGMQYRKDIGQKSI
ncbi:MAG: phosphoribosylamine--glycine ligase [Candidatus Taylorbacteria bacterium]|nr:phosphoribosylamine--glycine ligase [Candidatus Taylorbacteria bacterium]